jgi:hypothetical protein
MDPIIKKLHLPSTLKPNFYAPVPIFSIKGIPKLFFKAHKEPILTFKLVNSVVQGTLFKKKLFQVGPKP